MAQSARTVTTAVTVSESNCAAKTFACVRADRLGSRQSARCYRRAMLRFSIVAIAGAALSCSASDGSSQTTGDAGKDVALDAAPAPPCSDPSDDPAAQCVETVSGKAVDTTGAPIVGKVVSICGSVCYYAQTKEDGAFVAKVDNFINVANFAAYVHGRPDYVGLFEKLPLGPTRNIVISQPMVLPTPPTSGARLPIDATTRTVKAAASIASGDVTLTFEAGTDVELDLEDIELKDKGEELRVVKVDAKDTPTFAKGATLLYGAMPFDAKFSRKVGVTIATDGGLAEGTAVEIFALGSDFVKLRTAGRAVVLAAGKVVGGKIQTDPGEGINLLTWVGVRPKP